MRNQEKWTASKFVYKNGQLIASRNPAEVGVGSRLNADIIASLYDAALGEHARGKLLDLGCGKVPLYATYRNFCTDVVCVDWANTAHKNEFLDHELDLTKKLPFANDEFDTIVLSDVLEHIPVPELLWQEMTRILSPGGKIIMNVPFYYWLHEEPHDYYRYTEFALRRFVEINALNMIHLESTGGAVEIIADILAKTVVKMPLFGRNASAFLQWLALAFSRTGIGHKVSATTRTRFPLGYFLVAEKLR